MKKLIYLFTLLLSVSLSVPPLTAQLPDEDIGGFLALSIVGGGDITTGSSTTSVIGIDFRGASQDYDIQTQLLLLHNILYTSEMLQNKPPNDFYPFSFFALSIDYAVFRWRNVTFNAGYLAAHQGYLYSGLKNVTFQIQLGPRAGVQWFFHKHFMIKGGMALPIGVYRHNLESSFVVQSDVELTFDPLGPISNPRLDTAFYSIGLETEYISFNTDIQNFKLWRYRPYFRFSLLY